MKNYLNKFEQEVFERLCKAGETYIVGGFVRDLVMGKIKPRTKNIMFLDPDDSNDLDIVTVLKPEEVEELFDDYTVDPYGFAFGTVAVCNETECVDVTTMKEKICIDDDGFIKVSFGNNIKRDLLLRDFTINTLLIDCNYNLIDYFGAKEDIKNRVLRYPPSNFPRYKIDPIVLFRAARFIAHGFKPDKKVVESFYDPEVITRLKYLSTWRVLKEFRKMSKGEITRGLYYLHDSGLLYAYFPELEEHKKYIENGIKTGKRKKFIEYIKHNDPNPIEVFRILRITIT